LTGEPVFAPLEPIWGETSDRDLDKWIETWKGKLGGQVVLVSPMPKLKAPLKADATRETSESLEELFRYEPGGGPWQPTHQKMLDFMQRIDKLRKMVAAEKPAALVYASNVGDGTIRVD